MSMRTGIIISTWKYPLVDGNYLVVNKIDGWGYSSSLYKHRWVFRNKLLLQCYRNTAEEASIVLKRWNDIFYDLSKHDKPLPVIDTFIKE